MSRQLRRQIAKANIRKARFMLKYVRVPDDVVLVDPTTGARLQRPDLSKQAAIKPCANCGAQEVAGMEIDPPYSMSRWLNNFVFVDPRTNGEEVDNGGKKKFIAAGRKMVETIAAVQKAFKNAAPGSVVVLSKSCWETILDILDNPGSAAIPMWQRVQFWTFYAAWINGSDEAPEGYQQGM